MVFTDHAQRRWQQRMPDHVDRDTDVAKAKRPNKKQVRLINRGSPASVQDTSRRAKKAIKVTPAGAVLVVADDPDYPGKEVCITVLSMADIARKASLLQEWKRGN